MKQMLVYQPQEIREICQAWLDRHPIQFNDYDRRLHAKMRLYTEYDGPPLEFEYPNPVLDWVYAQVPGYTG